MPYCTLRGIGGNNAFVGIERLRDFLWTVPNGIKFTPACVAHEFGHIIWCLLDQEVEQQVKKFYKQALKTNTFISNYSSWSYQEYFAEYCAYYTRQLSSNTELPDDKMLQMLLDLKS